MDHLASLSHIGPRGYTVKRPRWFLVVPMVLVLVACKSPEEKSKALSQDMDTIALAYKTDCDKMGDEISKLNDRKESDFKAVGERIKALPSADRAKWMNDNTTSHGEADSALAACMSNKKVAEAVKKQEELIGVK